MTQTNLIDGFTNSLWLRTAHDAPATQSLRGQSKCDVVIIGAGVTGLNAALNLAANGVSSVVLEAGELGGGSSGRSGGQINLGLNLGPADIVKHYGENTGSRLLNTVVNTPDYVFGLIEQYGLNCDPVRAGWVQAAATEKQYQQQQQFAAEYESVGARFDVLSADELQKKTGTVAYKGGLFCPVAGSVQPLSYTRELARASMQLGVEIYTHSAVEEFIKQSVGWLVKTGEGQVTCSTILVCTNAYTDNLVPGLAKKIVPVRSVLVATEPLSPQLQETILPKQITFVDKRRIILYFRYSRDGRLCVGDHGPPRDEFRLSDFNDVKSRAAAVFAPLADVRWDYHWGGRIAVTKDRMPFVHRIAPGMITGMGYNGRGMGMGSMMGKILASCALGTADDELGFPVTKPSSFKMHAFHDIGVAASIKWFALMDYLDRL